MKFNTTAREIVEMRAPSLGVHSLRPATGNSPGGSCLCSQLLFLC